MALSCALTLSLLVGCAQQAAPAPAAGEPAAQAAQATGDKKLVFWAPLSGGDFDFMNTIVGEYNATNPEYPVEFLSKDWGDTYYQSLNSSLMAESGPDVFVIHQSNLAGFIPTGKLADVSKIDAGVDWSKYNKAQLDSVKSGGAQYSVPLDTHALVLFYNKDILDRAGVTEDELRGVSSLDSWNAILDKIGAVVTPDEHVLDFATSGANTITQFWVWYVLTVQGGGVYMADGKSGMNSEAGVNAMQAMKDWHEKNYIKSGIEDATTYDLFKTGKAALNLTGVWSTGNYETAADLNFGVMPIPPIMGEKKTWGDSHTIGIPAYASDERKVAALKFADFVTDHSITWAKAGHVPSKPAVTESEEFKALPYRSNYTDVINDVVYYPACEQLSACNSIACTKISESFNGDSTAQEAMDAAAEEINAELSK